MGPTLAAALLVPLAGAGAAALWPRASQRAAMARCTAGLAALLWLAVLAGEGATAGRFSVDRRTAAAGVGASLLAAVVRRAGPGDLLALAAATAGVAAGLGGGHAGDLLAGLTVAVLAGSSEHLRGPSARHVLEVAPWAVAGLAALAAGTAALHDATGRLALPSGTGSSSRAAVYLFGVAAAAFVLAGSRRSRDGHAVLLPAGLSIGVHTAGALDGASTAAVVLAAAGVVAAWGVPHGIRRRGAPDLAGALALWSLAAAHTAGAGASEPGVAPLLGAAAVLTAVVGLHAAVVVAAPGGAALATGLRGDGSLWALAVGLLAIATAAAAVLPPARRRRRSVPLRAEGRGEPDPVPPALRWLPRPRPATGVAVVLAAWLLAAPGTWDWAGAVPFGDWSRTAVVGVPAAALLFAIARWAGLPAAATVDLPAPLPVPSGGGRPIVASRPRTVAALLTVGAAGAWLVLSLVRGR